MASIRAIFPTLNSRSLKWLCTRYISSDDAQCTHRESLQHSLLLFKDIKLTPEAQYALTKAFDPASESYGHGNNKTQSTKKSILHPDLKTIPRVPQVQLIGNGKVYDYEGLDEVGNHSSLDTAWTHHSFLIGTTKTPPSCNISQDQGIL